MPVMERELGDNIRKPEAVDESIVTSEEEYEIMYSAHSDVSAAKTYKLKIKIEDRKKQEEAKKDYTAVIHNIVSKNILNATGKQSNYPTKTAEAKVISASRSSAM